jgi:thiosulfate/3-mercaptopyruvate sulfurtransferase
MVQLQSFFAVVLAARTSQAYINFGKISLQRGTHNANVKEWHRQRFCKNSSTKLHNTSPTTASDEDELSTLASLYGKTLVSVQDCIEAYRQQLHHQKQQQPRTVFIDASWYHRPDPTTNQMRNPAEEFAEGPRLPNAHYLDIDALATTFELFPEDNPKNLPHMMPPGDLFGLAMDAYGIRHSTGDDSDGFSDHVIIYAKRGAVFTPRTWFLFISMGHDPNKVHLMQGSLEDWIDAGGQVENHSLMDNTVTLGEEILINRRVGDGYSDCFQGGVLNIGKLWSSRRNQADTMYQVGSQSARHVCDKEEVLQTVNEYLSDQNSNNNPATSNTLIIDTRGSGFAKKGHMPSAIHLSYRQMVNPSNRLQLLPKSELHDLFAERGIDYLDPTLKIILSCGSGVSVCHGFLALKELGREITEENTRVYDGSWKEWGRMEEDLPRVLPSDMK